MNQYHLPRITGSVSRISLDCYERIIANYVSRVSQLEQVLSIIQIGSFTAPGLSDIDLIVVLDDGDEQPRWEEISLKHISKDIIGSEVIAHDVFVINKSIADKIEAYFYVDAQKTLYGDSLGGKMSNSLSLELSNLLAIDYAVFSLESIFHLMRSREVHIRQFTLLISTMRHSLALAAKHYLISIDEMSDNIERIERFRQDVLDHRYVLEDMKDLLLSFVEILYKTCSHLVRNNMNTLAEEPLLIIQKNSKVSFVSPTTKENYSAEFLRYVKRQKFKKYGVKIPIPKGVMNHLANYWVMEEEFFRKHYPYCGLKFTRYTHLDNMNLEARKLRLSACIEHWRFLKTKRDYRVSGIAYIGFTKPEEINMKSLVRYYLGKYA